MSDHDALLAAILAQPDEDTPRLAFADWLDEHADALPNPDHARQRAQFVRDDILLSRLDENDPARLRWELVDKPRRESEPWAEAALPNLRCGRAFAREPWFRRGFPWCAALRPGPFLRHADEVFAAAPVTGLAYRGSDPAAEELFRAPAFARLRSLRAHAAHLSERAVQALVASPHTALEELDVRHDGLTPVAVTALLRSQLLPRLTRLELSTPLHGSYVAAALSAAGGPTRLRALTLSGCGLNGDNLTRLLTCTALEGVERLVLSGNPLAAAGHAALARLPLDRLRKLDLSETWPSAHGFRALCTSLTLSRLERLAYRGNHVSGPLLAELATCHEVANLRYLDLASNAVGNAGAAALARSPHLAGLRVLNLSHCMVGDEGARALLDSPLSESLVMLDLSGSPASAETQELVRAKMGDRVRL